MIDGLKAAADLARDWAAKGRATLNTKRSTRRDEVKAAFAALCIRIQARGFEAFARALDAMAANEDTPAQGTSVCPSCGNVRPAEWVPPKG